jgi:serine-type D-Ala-D-Ala carboxypeptidase/endopeptidase (penicillin-binding protein 4)
MFKIKWKAAAFCILAAMLITSSCSIERRIAKSANKEVLDATALKTAHVGISVYEPASNKYWFDYQGDKYFVPASNTKIPTCYAAMKYLGDSLRGLDYLETDTMVFIRSTGDPSFLHREYPGQPAFDFLKNVKKRLAFVYPKWEAEVFGSGWSWNDFTEAYMAERSDLPIYGNVIEYRLVQENGNYQLKSDIHYYRHALNLQVDRLSSNVRIRRRRCDNIFDVFAGRGIFEKTQIPFRTFENQRLLEDTLKKAWLDDVHPPSDLKFNTVRSRHTDSLLKPMMHRSDNFFAEQSLLMVSNEKLGLMNEQKIIDTLLKSDLKDLPQKPRWVDGSGLSRYNLFTPQDMVTILLKMQQEFKMERIREIFPTGGEGTLGSYYKSEAGYIYAKTGTLSGVVALSGYLYTRKNRLLLFSVLVNNHQASATDVRRAVEKFIRGLREEF